MELKNKITIIDRSKLHNLHGWFLKVIDGEEENLPTDSREIYITSATKRGQIRGEHYHIEATEWFTLIEGDAQLRLKDIETGEVIHMELSSSEPKTIVIPPSIVHSFINTADKPFLLLAYTDKTYVPEDTISYSLMG